MAWLATACGGADRDMDPIRATPHWRRRRRRQCTAQREERHFAPIRCSRGLALCRVRKNINRPRPLFNRPKIALFLRGPIEIHGGITRYALIKNATRNLQGNTPEGNQSFAPNEFGYKFQFICSVREPKQSVSVKGIEMVIGYDTCFRHENTATTDKVFFPIPPERKFLSAGPFTYTKKEVFNYQPPFTRGIEQCA
ncbi:MAG: hypothetical protein ABSE95_07485 [Thermodesulfobacteriota bacterium]